MDTRVKVFVPADYANLRSEPHGRAEIVGRLVDHQIVTQTGMVKNGWTELAEPAGWVFPGVDFVDLPQALPEDRVCDGLDSPVGTEAERATAKVWPGFWMDASPFGQRNFNGLHTGADLNLNRPHWNADAGMPLYAVADGLVTTVARFPGWMWLIVIRHDPLPDGTIIWSRYAHMQTITTVQGARVKRGHIIGTIGNADGTMPHHLHFDLVTSDVLKDKPEHWPKFNGAELEKHYVDPKLFIETHHYLKYGGG